MSSAQKNRRVLVIDDNVAIHQDFKKILESSDADPEFDASRADLFGDAGTRSAFQSFTIDSALQGQEGLQRVEQALAAQQPYALAFVDVRMPPGWDGIETLAQIWKVDPEIQAVICTAYSDYTLEDMLNRLGHTDRLVILKKPFDNVEVLQLANALTEKWELLQRVKSHINVLERDASLRTIELRRTEERFRLIAENATDIITLVDVDGCLSYYSPSFERLLGGDGVELAGTDVFARIHPEDRERARQAARDCFADGKPYVIEFRVDTQSDACCSLEAHASLVRRADGERDQLLIVARDITERNQSEVERGHMELQLRQAQKLESIGQLAAGIAHEINTPTQYIGDNTRFLKDAFNDINDVLNAQRALQRAAADGPPSAELIAEAERACQAADLDFLLGEIPKAIQQSLDGVDRVAKIVRAMKEFSHPGTTEKTAVDLNQSIESTLTVCRNEWKYVAEMVTNFDPNLPLVECMPGEINQTILNIVVNAAHAIGDVVGGDGTRKGTITVTTRKDEDWVEIRIQDTGTGIPERARAKVFDPFFTTKGVGRGTGQGLAIARSVLVDKHGGSISFETETGKGTTFVLRLPIRGADEKERKAA